MKNLALGTLRMIMVAFLTSRISHLSQEFYDNYLIQIFVCLWGLERLTRHDYLAMALLELRIILTPLWSPKNQTHATVCRSMQICPKHVNFVFPGIVISALCIDSQNGPAYHGHTVMLIHTHSYDRLLLFPVSIPPVNTSVLASLMNIFYFCPRLDGKITVH